RGSVLSAAHAVVGRVLGHLALRQRHGTASVEDATAVAAGGVLRDGALLERQSAEIVDTPAGSAGRVAAEGAPFERHRATVVDAAAPTNGRVAADGAVSERHGGDEDVAYAAACEDGGAVACDLSLRERCAALVDD